MAPPLMAPPDQLQLRLLLAAAVCGAALTMTSAAVHHASPSDGAAGLCKCLKAAMLPGDECRLHAGGSTASAVAAAAASGEACLRPSVLPMFCCPCSAAVPATSCTIVSDGRLGGGAPRDANKVQKERGFLGW